MKSVYELNPFDVINCGSDIYQVVLAIEPDLSLAGDNDTWLVFVLQQTKPGRDGVHLKFRCSASDKFDVYATANIYW